MKLFSCPNCGQVLYFENGACENCGKTVGYDPLRNAMLAQDGDTWLTPNGTDKSVQFCANAQYDACNWLISSRDAEPGALCIACTHNETIPDLSDPANLANWQVIERAKKRLFYALIRFGLPLRTRQADPERGLAFRFLAEAPGSDPVMTGHDAGVITIALAEADDAERVRRRTAMGEPYRTMLGHFRHEIAHYYWDELVAGTPALAPCRALFGDETEDYGAALQSHYQNGAPAGWPETHVSAYATAHPWEDFAETWAHYFHIVDTLETASAFSLDIAPKVDRSGTMTAHIKGDAYAQADTNALIKHWVPLTLVLNTLNRSIGQTDAYPFILAPRIVEKLDFIAGLVHRRTLAG